MEPTLTKTRSRLRGTPESLKFNVYANQFRHDIIKAIGICNSQDSEIEDNFINVVDGTEEMHASVPTSTSLGETSMQFSSLESLSSKLKAIEEKAKSLLGGL